jgi:peptidoglycan/LPS O-acetylase OafA/YrhL
MGQLSEQDERPRESRRGLVLVAVAILIASNVSRLVLGPHANFLLTVAAMAAIGGVLGLVVRLTIGRKRNRDGEDQGLAWTPTRRRSLLASSATLGAVWLVLAVAAFSEGKTAGWVWLALVAGVAFVVFSAWTALRRR